MAGLGTCHEVIELRALREYLPSTYSFTPIAGGRWFIYSTLPPPEGRERVLYARVRGGIQLLLRPRPDEVLLLDLGD